MGLIAAEEIEDAGCLLRQHGLQAFSQLGSVLAVAGDHARRADDADATLAFIELAAAGQGVLLQAVEADIQADHRQHLAVLQQWEGNAGDQLAAA
ncbi:hypothetical protein D9M71_487920 [compost metagenome]